MILPAVFEAVSSQEEGGRRKYGGRYSTIAHNVISLGDNSSS
jgi:hypothetical protein